MLLSRGMDGMIHKLKLTLKEYCSVSEVQMCIFRCLMMKI